jgi:hypothetical protein
MTNGDPNPHDPVGEFAAAARKIEALKAEVIAALGKTAAGEAQRPADTDLVAEASRIIVSSLTEIADVLHQTETRNASKEGSPEAEPTVIAQPEPSVPFLEKILPPKPVSLSEEELEAELRGLMARSKSGTMSVGRIAFTLGGGKKLAPDTYRTLLRTLNAHPNASYLGDGKYNITPIVEEGALNRTQPQVPSQESESADQVAEAVDDVSVENTVGTEADNVDALGDQNGVTEVAGETSEDDEDDEDSEEQRWAELVGMSARWMGRQLFFTTRHLRDHLLANLIISPEEVKGNKINDLMAELMPYVEEYYFDRGEIVSWLNDRKYAAQMEEITGKPSGRGPVKFSLGFMPRKDIALPDVTDVKAGAPAAKEELHDTQTPTTIVIREETRGQHERDINTDQIQLIVDVVANVGNAVKIRSLLEILTDPDEYNLTRDEAASSIDAAVAEGMLFRIGIEGRIGVSLDPPSKRPAGEVIDKLDPQYIEQKIKKYDAVVKAVMDTLMPLEQQQGLPYIKLWNRNQDDLKDTVAYDEFKAAIRAMKTDGLVMILKNVRLHTKTVNSNSIRGDRIHVASSKMRAEWHEARKAVLRRIATNERVRLETSK